MVLLRKEDLICIFSSFSESIFLDVKFYNVSDFEPNILERVRFLINIFTRCHFLERNFSQSVKIWIETSQRCKILKWKFFQTIKFSFDMLLYGFVSQKQTPQFNWDQELVLKFEIENLK